MPAKIVLEPLDFSNFICTANPWCFEDVENSNHDDSIVERREPQQQRKQRRQHQHEHQANDSSYNSNTIWKITGSPFNHSSAFCVSAFVILAGQSRWTLRPLWRLGVLQSTGGSNTCLCADRMRVPPGRAAKPLRSFLKIRKSRCVRERMLSSTIALLPQGKDEEMEVNGREKVKGSGAWRKWTAAALLRVTFLQVKEQLKVMSRLLSCGATYCQDARSAICNVWLDSQARGVFYR